MGEEYNIKELDKLIKDYVLHEKEFAGTELSYKLIKGDDLVRILDDFRKIFSENSRESHLDNFLISLQKMIPDKKDLNPEKSEEIFKKMWAEIYNYGSEMGVWE